MVAAMKKALLLCAGLCLFLVSLAEAAPAIANFASERGVVFQLIFDGRALTQAGTRQITLSQIAPGYHRAEFLIPAGYGRSVSYRTNVFLDGGLETTFVLITRTGYPPQLRKVSALPIRRGGYNSGPRGPYPPTVPSTPEYDVPPSYPSGYPSSVPSIMSPRDVDDLLQTVQRQSFDDNKLAIIREALREMSLPADDARRLVTTLAFDRNRIELAKYLYTRVADRQNFYRVYEALQYQSSIREVQQFVDSYQR